LSLACRGRAIRNQHLRARVRLLGYGLVSEARQYLAAIPAEDSKDTAAIERLEAYSGAQQALDSLLCAEKSARLTQRQ
jgi:hypothetical protein